MKRGTVILYCILLLAAGLRFYRLGQIPEGFHADEASYGYNAYSLLRTGKDEYGKTYPLVFKSFGDYKAAVYSYIDIPFIALFGLNEFSVRAPSAIFGVLYVYLTYLFLLYLSKNRNMALIAAGVSAVLPVGIELSRVQSDPLICVFFFYAGIYLLLLWMRNKSSYYLLGSLISIIVSYFTYTSTRIFSIPFFLLTAWFYRRKLKTYVNIWSLAFAVILLVIVAYVSLSAAGGRFSQVSVFNTQEVQLLLNEKLREEGVAGSPAIWARIFDNKLVGYLRFMAANYSKYLSADFLFLQAGQPLRERIPDVGVLSVIDLPFLLIGAYIAIRKKIHYGIFSVFWVLLVPLVFSITSQESPNIHRFFLAILPITMLTAIGILQSYDWFTGGKRPVFAAMTISLYGISLLYFLNQLFVHQPLHFPFYRGFAYKQLVGDLPKYYKRYNKIIVTKGNESPYIYILFFGKYDPAAYQASGSHRDLDYQGFDKYEFVPYDCPSFDEGKTEEIVTNNISTLLVRRGGCQLGKNDHLLEVIPWRGGSQAFQIVNYQATQSGEFNLRISP